MAVVEANSIWFSGSLQAAANRDTMAKIARSRTLEFSYNNVHSRAWYKSRPHLYRRSAEASGSLSNLSSGM